MSSKLFAVLLVVLMVAGSLGFGVNAMAYREKTDITVPAPGSSAGGPSAEAWKSKVDPRLLQDSGVDESLLNKDAGVSIMSVLESYAHVIPSKLDGKQRVIVYFTGGDAAVRAIKSIAPTTAGFRLDGASSGYVIAWADRSQIEELAKLPYVVSIVPDLPREIPTPRSDADFETEGDLGALIYGATDIMGAKYAWAHGYRGDGVKVAVVDTGVDMGESDLGVDALARDAFGRPLLFDSDEVGFTLTIAPAVYTGNGTVQVLPVTIGNYTGIPFYFTNGDEGFIAMTNYTLMYVEDQYTGNYTVLALPVVNAEFVVPPEVNENSTVRFGLASQLMVAGPFVIWYLAPVINVDLDGDGTFDGVYVDISTMYFLFTYALYSLGYGQPADPALLDMSFADEQLLNYNNPVAARDFTGDGVNDFSLGAIAGSFMDVHGVLTGESYSFDWLNDFEHVSYIIPGYDQWYGQWVDFEYDFHSHGTFCAHVIAGRGKVARPLGYGDIYYNLTGVAPNATIGGASALFNGTVLAALLYFSGFTLVDPANFTWAYTGYTQADVISNSWGSSYLIINGYASDADPISLWEDFLTRYTGTIIVHAAGNGGPGYGTMTMAGTATSVITVGASTEFLYRPYYGYLPGAYYQVVSWSDRGPTQLGYPKPDVVNVGSFAWSVGRVIDGLGDGLYSFDLFGGTSEATPMTAGAVAILVQALRDNGYQADPATVKTLLKASARDLGYDPFTQGAGHVDLKKAIDMIASGALIPRTDAPLKVSKYFDDTMATMLGLSKSFVSSLFATDSDTSLYFGVVKPGEAGTANVTLTGLDGSTAPVSVEGAELKTLVEAGKLKLSEAADLSKAVLLLRTSSGYQILPVPNKYVAILGDYVFVRLDKLPSGSRLLVPLKPEAEQALRNATLAQIDAYYPYKYMDPFGRRGGYATYFLMGVEASYWIDYNNDNLLLPWETARIQYDIREGNAFHVQIGKPAEAFDLAAQEALNYLEEYYGLNASSSYKAPVIDFRFFVNAYYGIDAPVLLPLRTTITLYNEEDMGWNVTVTGDNPLQVSVEVPQGTKPGVYEGYLELYTSAGEYKLPVSIAVPAVVAPGVSTALVGGGEKTIYKNYVFMGALDQGWRPETGDWRVYPVMIEDNELGRVVGLKVSVTWSNPSSSFDVAINGPGLNFWGVGDYNYLAWVDAATVAAKISGLSYILERALNETVNGVYTYFDRPTTTRSEVIGPIAGTIYDPDASVYWVVVHQIFQHYKPETVRILLTPLTLSDNVVSVSAGGAGTKLVSFFSSNIGAASQLGAPVVIPLTGGSPSDINVAVLPSSLAPTPIKQLLVVATASESASGAYLVLVPYISEYPSVIWGGVAYGEEVTIYEQPLIFYAEFLVVVNG
ncbi:MAG: S8 family serine peptidase [Desulfurococcales archaeon]|nr:S8 family serine peptidase [Desulfurococcales archaeon]